MNEFRIIHHEAICPDCHSANVVTSDVDTGDGLAETAYQCRACGAAWPLACISDLETQP
jgi:hypothetical protein